MRFLSKKFFSRVFLILRLERLIGIVFVWVVWFMVFVVRSLRWFLVVLFIVKRSLRVLSVLISFSRFYCVIIFL